MSGVRFWEIVLLKKLCVIQQPLCHEWMDDKQIVYENVGYQFGAVNYIKRIQRRLLIICRFYKRLGKLNFPSHATHLKL
ncbi:CLUMA_CG015730, isoform A [Clunio marinus]|uniref:CLUMA_CG015730, isoform A n=1 Tax=Clunio marinus TaxID=568069 RepID=A0A1J1IQH7_9DIPT|nr:CLUMA_CG015730, isoform A [Clunio marinus]